MQLTSVIAFFILKLFIVFVGLQGLRFFFIKKIKLKISKSSTSFLESAKREIQSSFFSFGVDHYIQKVKDGQLKSRRTYQFSLCLMGVSQVLFSVAIFLLMYEFCWQGWFSGLNVLFNQRGEPISDVVNYSLNAVLSGSSLQGLMICMSIGTFLGILFRRPGFAAIIGMTLLFPFLISVSSFVFLMVGEFAGILIIKTRHWSQILPRRISLIISIVIFWIFGSLWKFILVTLGLVGSSPFERTVQVAVLYGIFLAIDAILAMISYHFYYLKTGESTQ